MIGSRVEATEKFHFLFLASALIPAIAPGPSYGQPVLYVVNGGNNTVGEYSALTGAAINAAFINGQGPAGPAGIVRDANNHLFISNAGFWGEPGYRWPI
jgi:hypothetical protein